MIKVEAGISWMLHVTVLLGTDVPPLVTLLNKQDPCKYEENKGEKNTKMNYRRIWLISAHSYREKSSKLTACHPDPGALVELTTPPI